MVISGIADPTKDAPIAIAYVHTQYAMLDSEIYVEVRDKNYPCLYKKYRLLSSVILEANTASF